MRLISVWARPVAVVGLVVAFPVVSSQPTGAMDARATVARGRAAVAPCADLSCLRSLVLRGRVRVPQEGARFAEGQVSIKILLPGRYQRVDSYGSSNRESGDRSQFGRLMLGIAAYLAPDLKLTVRPTGDAAFEGTAAVDVGGGSFSARLVFDVTSGVPLRLTYFEKGTVSTVMSFADRRPVDGFQLPFRVSTQTPQRVLETLSFDEILVNPPLGKGDFKR